eukprot:Amastigsp_a340384_131.p4 type:complete len:140 gc:universal Amastigsp_a340384_131:431-12(-)
MNRVVDRLVDDGEPNKARASNSDKVRGVARKARELGVRRRESRKLELQKQVVLVCERAEGHAGRDANEPGLEERLLRHVNAEIADHGHECRPVVECHEENVASRHGKRLHSQKHANNRDARDVRRHEHIRRRRRHGRKE